MTAPTARRLNLLKDGRLIWVDPSVDDLPYILALNRGFTIKSEPPPAGFRPALERTRHLRSDVPLIRLANLSLRELFELHDRLLFGSGTTGHQPPQTATALDLKLEIASRLMASCTMCGHLCGVNRFEQQGKCGLLDEAYVARVYIHVAEEPPLTPSAVLQLGGCALRCHECQAHEVLPLVSHGTRLSPHTLDELRARAGFEHAKTIEFVGGDPNESLYAILETLTLSTGTRLPIVWNTHAYGSAECWRLLSGIVDVYVPDLKGCDACLERYAGVQRYWEFATAGLEAMIRQRARVIVRILVMPDHFTCCHEPSLRWLAQHRDQVWLSFHGLVPAWKRTTPPASAEEIERVKALARELGLRDVHESNGRFWCGAHAVY